MAGFYVRDTVLYICTGRLPHRAPTLKEKMRSQRPSGRNGKCVVRKVPPDEMERLWCCKTRVRV